MATTAVEDSDFEERASIANIGADDSDAESLLDIEAPADGYFERRNIPQQTYVPNPANPPSKAEEAAIERLRNREPEDGTSGSTRLPEREVSAVPPLDAEAAPPDYHAATAGQREQQEQVFSSDHPLVRNGLLAEHGVFGQRNQPQSMQDVAAEQPASSATEPRNQHQPDPAQIEEQANEATPLVAKSSHGAQKRRRRSRFLKGCVLLLGVLILVIIAIVLTRIVSKDSSDGGAEREWPGQPRGRTGLRRPPHPHPSGTCDFNYDGPTQIFSLNASDSGEFAFEEWFQSDQNPYLLKGGSTKFSGTIQIYPSKEDRDQDEPDIRVEVHIATTGNIRINHHRFIKLEETRLEILFPHIANDGPNRALECFDIAVGIQVKRGMRLQFWDTVTANLDVVVDEGLFGKEERGPNSGKTGTEIDHTSSIIAVKGNVDVAYWRSGRDTYVETDSGDIRGYFALLDELGLTSKSGAISVKVDPKNASHEEEKPAYFHMTSTSGAVHADYPTHDDFQKRLKIPDRAYEVAVMTRSGHISGTYILGQSADFVSRSGEMDVAVKPYSTDLKYAILSTSTKSGGQRFELLSPYRPGSFSSSSSSSEYRAGRWVDELTSTHESKSGAIQVKYPDEWTGMVDVVTKSGDVKIRGRDVDSWMDVETAFTKRYRAWKGGGDSYMEVDTKSGAVDVLIGNA